MLSFTRRQLHACKTNDRHATKLSKTKRDTARHRNARQHNATRERTFGTCFSGGDKVHARTDGREADFVEPDGDVRVRTVQVRTEGGVDEGRQATEAWRRPSGHGVRRKDTSTDH